MANVARDLFLLSAIAFQSGKYDQAASLFVSSLSADDANEFLDQLEGMTEEAPLSSQDIGIESVSGTMADISRTIRAQIQSTVVALASDDLDLESDSEDDTNSDEANAEEDDVSTDQEAGDAELDDESPESDLESDDPDPDSPGERIVPSSLSSVSSAVKVKK